jgi:3',5'-cyclic AMP phosphodiesterase CpdA
LAAAGEGGTLRLGVIGDQTLAEDLDAAYEVLARGVEELARYHREVAPLDAVVHTGDLVESGEAPEVVAARFAVAAAVLDRLPVPWYPAAGDHDVNPPGYEPGSGDRSRRELFVRLVGERVPAAAHGGAEGARLLRYAVDLGGFRLIVLDSQEVAHAEPRWGDVLLARIGEGQLAWLAAELAVERRAGGGRPPPAAVAGLERLAAGPRAAAPPPPRRRRIGRRLRDAGAGPPRPRPPRQPDRPRRHPDDRARGAGRGRRGRLRRGLLPGADKDDNDPPADR